MISPRPLRRKARCSITRQFSSSATREGQPRARRLRGERSVSQRNRLEAREALRRVLRRVRRREDRWHRSQADHADAPVRVEGLRRQLPPASDAPAACEHQPQAAVQRFLRRYRVPRPGHQGARTSEIRERRDPHLLAPQRHHQAGHCAAECWEQATAEAISCKRLAHEVAETGVRLGYADPLRRRRSRADRLGAVHQPAAHARRHGGPSGTLVGLRRVGGVAGDDSRSRSRSFEDAESQVGGGGDMPEPCCTRIAGSRSRSKQTWDRALSDQPSRTARPQHR